jgi:serine/threonine protein kinase
VLFNRGGLIDGRFEVVRRIGRGGMGTVLEVARVGDRRHLALKYCDGGPLGRRRLIREARILANLSHPHVLPVLHTGFSHDPPYFVMPLAVDTLEADLRRAGRDRSWALRVFRQICLGVQGLHRAGVVHRDLKPSNILRLEDGRYVVADLGTAKREPRHSTVLTRTCAVLGTLTYLAPEQLMPGGSRQADERTDIYQLGKLLYQLLTGRSPAVIEPAILPAGLEHVVLRATATRPHDRYPAVATLLDAIDAYEASPGPAHGVSLSRTLARLGQQALPLLAAGSDWEPCRREILDNLAALDRLDPSDRIDALDQLPTTVLVALAQSDPAVLLARLNDHARSLERHAAHRPFDYADHVARRTRHLVQTTQNPAVAARALQALLVTSVALNRYAAMGAFRLLLYQVRQADVALAVAEMLREHRDYLQEIAPGLNPRRLHPILAQVLSDLDWIETVSF